MTFLEKRFEKIVKEIDAEYGRSKAQAAPVAPPPSKEEALLVPSGDVYAVYRRSNKGRNKIVLFNLPKADAEAYSSSLNLKEREKRRAMSMLPEEVFLYDVVKQGTEQEDPYWNPSVVVVEN